MQAKVISAVSTRPLVAVFFMDAIYRRSPSHEFVTRMPMTGSFFHNMSTGFTSLQEILEKRPDAVGIYEGDTLQLTFCR